jgi:hypothetical protein
MVKYFIFFFYNHVKELFHLLLLCEWPAIHDQSEGMCLQAGVICYIEVV